MTDDLELSPTPLVVPAPPVLELQVFTARPGFQLVRIVKVLPTAHIGIDRLALFLKGGFPAPVWREEAAVIPCQVYLTYLDCSGPLSSQSSSQVGFETIKLGVSSSM